MITNNIAFDQHHVTPLHTKEYVRMSGLLETLPWGKTTLWEWARNGLFPTPIKIHGTTVWKCSEVLLWLEAFKQQSLKEVLI